MNKSYALSAFAIAALALPALAQATVTQFQTVLGAAGEPVPTSTATGAAIVSFDDALNSVTVLTSFAGLANASPFAHIHCCTASPGTGNAPVVVNFTAFPAVSTGSYIASFTLAPAAFNSLLAGSLAGLSYVNIHTPGTYAGGEIRGFLAAVPEPSTYALLLSGLALVGFMARRRNT